MSERLEPAPSTSPTYDFSPSKFYEDIYHKGIVKAVDEHPREAVFSAGAAVAFGTAAICIIKERALSSLMGAAGEEVGQSLRPAANVLMRSGVPITAETRAAAVGLPELRAPAWDAPNLMRDALGKGGGHTIDGTAGVLEQRSLRPLTPEQAAHAVKLRAAMDDLTSNVKYWLDVPPK